MNSFLSDNQLFRSDSPTQREDLPNEITYKVLNLTLNEWEFFEDKFEAKIRYKELINESIVQRDIEVIQLIRVVNDTDEYLIEQVNTAEKAFELVHLFSEIMKIKSSQFELTSDEVCRINDLEKEIKSIINI